MQPSIASLSLFFPVFNEAEGLSKLLQDAETDLMKLGIDDYELIVVDDGSTDGSSALADRIAAGNPNVRVIHHSENQGYGAALKSGFMASTKEWVMYNDGDGQFRVADLGGFLPSTPNYPVVLGYRLQRQDHWGRKLNATMWSGLVWLVLGLRVKDLDCGFKLIRRDALTSVQPLEASGAVISAELLTKLKRRGFTYSQVGVHHYPRRAGNPTGAKLSVIARAFRELVLLRWHLRTFR